MGNTVSAEPELDLAVAEGSEILKSRNLTIDDIKRMRDLESATRGIMQKYHAAMRQMEVRFEIHRRRPECKAEPQPHTPRRVAAQKTGEHI